MKELPEEKGDWNDPLIIDMNSNVVTFPYITKLPKLPEHKKLLEEVSVFYNKFQSGNSNSKNSLRKCTKEEIRTVDDIMDTFRRYNMQLLDTDLIHHIGASETGEKELTNIVKQFPKNFQPLYNELVVTQQFAVHATEVKLELEEHNSEMGSTLTKLEQMIKDTTKERADVMAEISQLRSKLKRIETRLSTLQASKAKLNDDASYRSSPLRHTKHRRNKSWFQ